MSSRKQIVESISRYHLLSHPFYRDWMEGKLSREMLRDYACQYATHVEAFPRYVSAVHSLCEKADERRILAENLADEEGLSHGTPHPELWMRFAEGMGADRSEVRAAEPRAAIRKVKETFLELARSSYHEGLGALYAYESQVPEIAKSKIDGLKEHYGIDDERTLSFFEAHRTADVYHREAIEKILGGLSERQASEAAVAAQRAAQALWDFLTDVHGTEPSRMAC